MQVCTMLQSDNHSSTPPLSFLQAGCPSCRPTNSVKALKALTYPVNQVENSREYLCLPDRKPRQHHTTQIFTGCRQTNRVKALKVENSSLKREYLRLPEFGVSDNGLIVSSNVDSSPVDMLTFLERIVEVVDVRHVLIDAVKRSLGAHLVRPPYVNAAHSQSIKQTQTQTRTHARRARARLTALFPGIPRWASTRKVKPIWILLKRDSEW